MECVRTTPINAKDMDGAVIRTGDYVVCMAFSKAQPCLAIVVSVDDDGLITVDNGSGHKRVDPESCILQAAG